MSATKLNATAVLRVLARRVPMQSEKARNENLSYAAGSMAEAYAIGVEECQREMLARVRALTAKQQADSLPDAERGKA